MKNFLIVCTVAAAVVAGAAEAVAPADPAASCNLLKSGGFECKQSGRYIGMYDDKGRAVGGWLTDNKCVKPQNDWVKLDDKVFASGAKSICLDNPTGTDVTVVQFFKLRKNTAYKLTFSVKAEVKQATGSIFAMLNTGKNEMFPPRAIRATSDWKTYSFTFKTPTTLDEAKSHYLRLQNYKLVGTAWFDDVKIEEVKP